MLNLKAGMPFRFVCVKRAAAGGGARTLFDVDKCCFKLQLATCKMLIIISSPLHRLRPLCWRSLFCTAAMQVFLPVSLVFALHMIKIWNYKNRNRTGTAVFIKIPIETDHTSENGNRHSTSDYCRPCTYGLIGQ